MDPTPAENIPLREQSSTLSDISFGSNSTVVASPAPPTHHRPGYRRVSSQCEESDSHSTSSIRPSDNEGQGLGILNLGHKEEAFVSSVKVGSKESPNSSRSTGSLLSPRSARLSSTFNRTGDGYHNVDNEDSYYPHVHDAYQGPLLADAEYQRLHWKEVFLCTATKRLASGRTGPTAILMLMLSFFSTVFSSLWLVVAIRKPEYGHKIGPNGLLTSQVASWLCAGLAKLIELSFVTVIVAVIGQVLSRRALRESKGITIAEMFMKSWVSQPGTMISHWHSLCHAGPTGLGIIVITAAITSMSYTTASNALVIPIIDLGRIEQRELYGQVATSFANTKTLTGRCTTPIQSKDDPDSGTTCIQIPALRRSLPQLHAVSRNMGRSQRFRQRFFFGFEGKARTCGDAVRQTVKGSWIQVQNMTELSKKFSRITNNVTMAMPHSGVFKAARHPLNDITQPHDLSVRPSPLHPKAELLLIEIYKGPREYYIQATVSSPAVNVLCTNMSQGELMPMVYSEWPESERRLDLEPNSTTWPKNFSLTLSSSTKQTVVDDLFNFDDVQIHPIFPKLPDKYNSVFNYSITYGAQAVYLLIASPAKQYTLCSIRTALTPDCFTTYHSSAIGGSLNTTCDPSHRLSYTKSQPEATNGNWNKDWKDIALEWGNSLSLNDGITDGQSSNARLLSYLIPRTDSLDDSKPSISEALAVLAGNTLLLSALDSPFIHYWNYTSEYMKLKEPRDEKFSATLRTMTYRSGGAQNGGQEAWILILIYVFLANVGCLIYFLSSGQIMTDFMEPENLFSLSLLSPPSAALEGACAKGPNKRHLTTDWNIKLDRERNHLWIDGKEAISEKHIFRQHPKSISPQHEHSGIQTQLATTYDKLRQERISSL